MTYTYYIYRAAQRAARCLMENAMGATRHLAKNVTSKAVALSLAAIMFAACSVETSDNGKLDGMWHLTQIDTLATGGTNDKSNEKIYWMFQFNLLHMVDKYSYDKGFLFRFALNESENSN